LKSTAGLTALAGVPATTAATGRSLERTRTLYATAQNILDRTDDLEKFYSFLESKSFSVARQTGRRAIPAQAASTDGDVGTQYQSKYWVDLDIGLSWDTWNDVYFGQANWHWNEQTLAPKDVVALTYKENSWSVPQNGYDSSGYCTLDTDSRSANGYAWLYADGEDNLSSPNAYNYASLELNPYDPSISDSDRTIWMVYTANSSIYPGWVQGISLGYGVLSVDVTPDVDQDTWIEDNAGDELKISQADASVR
jgi:hypothetical protein